MSTPLERVIERYGFTEDENPSATVVVGMRPSRYLLRDAESADAVGEFVTLSTWGLGDVFTAPDGRRLRIVDMLGVDDPISAGVEGLWLVEPA